MSFALFVSSFAFQVPTVLSIVGVGLTMCAPTLFPDLGVAQTFWLRFLVSGFLGTFLGCYLGTVYRFTSCFKERDQLLGSLPLEVEPLGLYLLSEVLRNHVVHGGSEHMVLQLLGVVEQRWESSEVVVFLVESHAKLSPV